MNEMVHGSRIPAPGDARAAGPMIRLSHVGKTFTTSEKTVVALDDVNLEIAAGEFVAVVGPSGSGKTTLMQIVGCLEKPSGGSYELEGQSVEGLDDRALSRLRNRCIGFVFQSFNLIPRTTALENVETPLLYGTEPVDGERARELLGLVGLSSRASHFPAQLSGGEQQRVAIARALVTGPRLLIADEPTGNLDPVTGAEIMSLIRKCHDDGLTILLVTHDPAIARQAGRIVSLADGRITGTPSADARGAGAAEMPA